MSAATLTERIHEFVRFSEDHATMVIDVAVLRTLSGLALAAASDKGYADFVGNRGDDLIPVWDMVSWLRLERDTTDPVDYEMLLGLIQPVEQFTRENRKPPAFGTQEFRLAPRAVKANVQSKINVARWQDRAITPDAIRLLHKHLILGDTQAQAAAQANMNAATAMRIRLRTYPNLKGDLLKTWVETF
ncbi:MAG: hypothetical protein ACK5A0_10420, partial [Polaromonas sp.]